MALEDYWYQSAFLQEKPLERYIFIVSVTEAHTKKLWKPQKCVYNLNDAVRKWYVPVFEELERLGCHGYSVDYGVFFW